MIKNDIFNYQKTTFKSEVINDKYDKIQKAQRKICLLAKKNLQLRPSKMVAIRILSPKFNSSFLF